MRKTAIVENDPKVKRVMIYSKDDGAYLFLYNTLEDSGAIADYWFKTIADAEEACREDYKIDRKEWKTIDDPLPYCQHDWIAPVRIKGRELGKEEWGTLEILKDGKWEIMKS